MHSKSQPNYLAGYPANLTEQIHQLIDQDKIAERLLTKYPTAHTVRTDRALYNFVQEIREQHLRNASLPDKIAYDSKLQVLHNALGLHSSMSRQQGSKIKNRREIRIAALFKDTPPPFLRMIVVHELAHLKEYQHNKAFYQLCLNMEANYHQIEFDLRVYLTYIGAGGQPLWTKGLASSLS